MTEIEKWLAINEMANIGSKYLQCVIFNVDIVIVMTLTMKKKA